MKTLNYLLAGVVVALAVDLSSASAECATGALVNTALLNSPRYKEDHSELPLNYPEAPDRLEAVRKVDVNVALLNSPRYREDHSELQWIQSPAEIAPRNIAVDETTTLTKNTALLASPRYREDHPELMLGEPSYQLAPLK